MWRLQTRLLLFFGGLFCTILLAVGIAVSITQRENAKADIAQNLEGSGLQVLKRQLAWQSTRLQETTRLLSTDFAFKAAYAAGGDTLHSAMLNHLTRLDGIAWMMIVDLNGQVIADSKNANPSHQTFAWPQLLQAAEADENLENQSIVLAQDQPYQTVVLPLLLPDPAAWLVLSFPLDHHWAKDLSRLLNMQISLAASEASAASPMLASSWPPAQQPLLTDVLQHAPMTSKAWTAAFGDDETVIFVSPLTPQVNVILQRSLTVALAPYQRLQQGLWLLFAAGSGIAVLGAIMLARAVTRPIARLVQAVKLVEQGHYDDFPVSAARDEVGLLSQAFHQMLKGLREREQVRALLGKVVSSAIAEELLTRRIELGGEQRQVTVLFADIRGFTSICEQHDAEAILTLLNIYFTHISEVIEAQGGVIDKYIGDAVMALFGAPLSYGNDAERAVQAALNMQAAMPKVNAQLIEHGLPAIQIGIGINTAQVVAGNMGSQSRLNYTVVGDGVNLASRLEGLTSFYHVPILISETTYLGATRFAVREVDRVIVKGQSVSVTIYQPLNGFHPLALQHYQAAIECYHQQQWQAARAQFATALQYAPGDGLIQLYLQRVTDYCAKPPLNWAGVYRHRSK